MSDSALPHGFNDAAGRSWWLIGDRAFQTHSPILVSRAAGALSGRPVPYFGTVVLDGLRKVGYAPAFTVLSAPPALRPEVAR